MSRSGYSDDCDGLALWRGAVASAIKGRRGQKFLHELAAAMDAMPEKRLIADELEADGGYCTIGVLGHARGLDMSKIDPHDRDQVGRIFNIAPAMAAEIVYENDEANDGWEWRQVEICGPMRPWEYHKVHRRVAVLDAEERRWQAMRKWVADHIVNEA